MAEAKAKETSPSDPVAATQALVGEGWTVDHAEAPQVINVQGGTVQVKGGEYRAWKRSQTGTNLVEQTGDTAEQLAARIADWEAAQQPAEQPQPTAEQIASSQAATAQMSITSDARQVVAVAEQQKS